VEEPQPDFGTADQSFDISQDAIRLLVDRRAESVKGSAQSTVHLIEQDLRGQKRWGSGKVDQGIMGERVVPALVAERHCIKPIGSRCLEGFNDQRNGGFASVALDLDCRRLFLEHDGDDLVAQSLADMTQA
jgi:hypothetical protein